MKVGIAAYDIAVSKYRSTLSKLLISYGERVQFSVFEFKLKDKEYKDFILKIKSFYKDYENYLSKNNIEDSSKSIRIYILCESCLGKKVILGKKEQYIERRILII